MHAAGLAVVQAQEDRAPVRRGDDLADRFAGKRPAEFQDGKAASSPILSGSSSRRNR